jgi:prepilin-type N-terminal cleavage/methylation domain-containing protein
MLLYNARKSSSGFTLIEMMTVVIIIGVVAAIAAPNFLGLLNRNRINDAAQQVEGAIREAQRQAMRRGQPCSINVDDTNGSIFNPVANGCLLSNRVLNDLVQLNSSETTLTFTGKGNITGATGTPAMVVSIPNASDSRKCVVLEGMFGTLRSGDYSTAIAAGATPAGASCQ